MSSCRLCRYGFQSGTQFVVGVDWDKPIVRVEVILSGFVDHSKHAGLFRLRVRQNWVDLPELQRSWYIIVTNTDDVFMMDRF